MTTSERIKLYFEYGFVITDEEQATHDRLMKKTLSESKERAKRNLIAFQKKLKDIKSEK